MKIKFWRKWENTNIADDVVRDMTKIMWSLENLSPNNFQRFCLKNLKSMIDYTRSFLTNIIGKKNANMTMTTEKIVLIRTKKIMEC